MLPGAIDLDWYDEPEAIQERINWARGLQEKDLRTLANDYARGDTELCSFDAHRELARRVIVGDLPRPKRWPRCPRHKSAKKLSTRCPECQWIYEMTKRHAPKLLED